MTNATQTRPRCQAMITDDIRCEKPLGHTGMHTWTPSETPEQTPVMYEDIRKIWDERPQALHQEVYGQLGNPADDEVEDWARRLALATLQAAPQPDATDHGALDYRDGLECFIGTLGEEE